MRGQSRKRPVRRKRLQKALVLALAGVMVSNSAGVGMLESFADETELTGSLGDNGETGGTETGTGTENGGGNSETGGNNETSGTETGSGNDGASGTETGSGNDETSGTETGSGNDGAGETETGDGNDGTITDGEGDGTVTDGGDDGTGTDGEDEGTETDGEGDGTVADGEGDGTVTDGGDDGTTTDGGDDGTTTDGGDDGTGTDGEDDGAGADDEDDGTGTDDEDSDAGTDDESGAVGDSGSAGGAGSAGTGGESGTNGIVSEDGTDTEKDSFIIDYYCDEELGTVRGPQRVEKGESLYFTVVPREGAVIVSVTANGMDVAPIVTATGSELKNGTGRQNYVLIDVEEDVEIEVDFAVAGVMAMSAEIPDPGTAGSDVDYQEMSSAFRIDYDSIVFDSETKNYYIDVIIEETSENELTFSISDAVLGVVAWYEDKDYNGMQPGDYINLCIRFINESGNQYSYQNGSLVVAPPDLRNQVAAEGDIAHAIGFDGQEVSLNYAAARYPNQALQELFGKKEDKISLNDMLNLYNVLREKPEYAELEYPLTQWYLDFYNDKYFLRADCIADLTERAISDMLGPARGVNAIFDVPYEGSSFEEAYSKLENAFPYVRYCRVIDYPEKKSFSVQIAEIEPEIGALIYNVYFQRLIGITVGRKTYHEEANSMKLSRAVAVSQYMTENSAVWEEANQALSSLNIEKLGTGELDTSIIISGEMNNTYQNYPIDYYATIKLDRIITEGTLTIHKVDDDGNIIAAPATFQLFKMDGDQKLYYTGSDWSTDAAQSADFVTENGTVTIPGLDLGVYYIQEVQAPEGYELVTEPYQVSLEGETLEVNFSNKIQYTIIVNYYEKDTNTKLADSYVSGTYTRGEAYDVTEQIQKAIEGYNWDSCDSAVYAGTMSGNLIFNVYYTKTPTTDEPDNEPSGGSPSGSGGGGGSSSGPRDPYNPGGGPGVTIEEDAVPLAPLPENNEAVAINEDNVPLSPLPKTGQERSAATWLAMLSGLVTAAYVLFNRKREQN